MHSHWKMGRRASESSLGREYTQVLSSWQEKTKENHREDYRFRIQNFQRTNKGVEITNYGGVETRLNVLPVYEWAHLWETSNHLVSMLAEVKQGK